MHVPTLISRKREGGDLSSGEIRDLVAGFTQGEIPEYQMSAFAMAVYFRGMTAAETAALTVAMMESGEVFRFPAGRPPVVDKHSTGGIGDKVSLVLASLLACTGCWVPMVSGRGLGITGGTLDKLESIPGLNVHLTLIDAIAQLEKIGVVMMGQTDRFCPADKKLYALRDVTGTVPSIPLITASIMSKKMAESLDRLVLDVKFGSGAFMRTREEAEKLADSMIAVGREMGVDVKALLHPMSEPTGRAVGNALEVAEALECLDGKGPADLRTIVLDLAEAVADSGREELEKKLNDGTARRLFEQMVEEQGGSADDLPNLTHLHEAPLVSDFVARRSGKVIEVDAGLIGQASLQLGAGRARADDAVDFSVGFDRLIKSGEEVQAGDPLCRVHSRKQADHDMAAALLDRAIRIE